jgi:outer membrane protein assembly factor BamB
LIVNGTNRIRAYDVENGKVVWACGGLSANIVASPVFSDGVVIAGSSYEKRAMMGILVQGAEGDITGTKKVAWRNNYLTPYVPSLLLYKNQLYFLRHYQGIMSRLDAKTGEAYGPPIRLQGFREIYASPVAAADRIYVTDREGTTVVLSHKDWPKVLATNQLDDRINASAAIVDNELYLRGEKYLYRIEETKNKPAR